MQGHSFKGSAVNTCTSCSYNVFSWNKKKCVLLTHLQPNLSRTALLLILSSITQSLPQPAFHIQPVSRGLLFLIGCLHTCLILTAPGSLSRLMSLARCGVGEYALWQCICTCPIWARARAQSIHQLPGSTVFTKCETTKAILILNMASNGRKP